MEGTAPFGDSVRRLSSSSIRTLCNKRGLLQRLASMPGEMILLCLDLLNKNRLVKIVYLNLRNERWVNQVDK